MFTERGVGAGEGHSPSRAKRGRFLLLYVQNIKNAILRNYEYIIRRTKGGGGGGGGGHVPPVPPPPFPGSATDICDSYL